VTEATDVIVIGGGAVGAACARELAQAGRRVRIIEPEADRGQAWRAAAGMLAPQIEAREGDVLLDLGLAGRELYAELAPALRESTGIDIGLWRGGIANVALNEADVASLRGKVAWQRQQGHLCDWLDAAEVKARWPWLAPTHGALWAPREGALDPLRLVQALRADAAKHGAVMVRDEAVGLETLGDRIVAVAGRVQRYPTAHVVLAAGAWSGRVAGLPRPLSIEPIKGEMAALPWPAGVERSVVYSRDCYLLARDGEALVGSTMEYAGFDASVTSAGLGRIMAGAALLAPPLANLDVRRTWAGLRPATPDGLPILGAEPRLRGLWYATGHGRNGILLAAISGLLVRLMLTGQRPTEDLTAFRPDRFWSW
jgi:glycine oxidase